MSEPIGITIEVGGKLPQRYVEKLLSLAMDEIYEIYEGPTTLALLEKEVGETITWQGMANYGLVEELCMFLYKHNMPYVHHMEAKYEYDSTVLYWFPGMKKAGSLNSTNEGQKLVRIDDLRPYCDLLLDLAEKGPEVLPTFIGNADLKDIIELGLKNPKQLYVELRQKFAEILPVIPEVPPFEIIY